MPIIVARVGAVLALVLCSGCGGAGPRGGASPDAENRQVGGATTGAPGRVVMGEPKGEPARKGTAEIEKGREKAGDGAAPPVAKVATPQPDALAERLLESVLGGPGHDYTLRGYAGLSFGDTKDEVERVSPIAGGLRGGTWLALKNKKEVLLSPRGELVGVATTFSEGDNKRSAAKLRDLFGPPGKDNVETFSGSRSPAGSREDLLRVTYHFPETIAVVRFVNGAIAMGRSDLRYERTYVAAFDRRWVVRELSEDAGAKREGLEWFRGVVQAGRPGGFDKEKLPARADSLAEEKPSSPMAGVYWSAKEKQPGQPDALAKREAAWGVRPWFAAIATQSFPAPDQPKGSVVCTLRLSRLPGLPDRPTFRGLLSHVAGRATSALAQEYFPPRGDTITVRTNGGATGKTYEWLTEGYLEVRVQPDNTVVVVRRAE